MKFVIVGAGALGSIMAAHLAKAGEEVILIARGVRAKYLKQNGITITGLADIKTECEIVTDPKTITEADVLVMTIKTFDMEEAIESTRHIEVSTVFSVQNGVMKNKQLAEAFGKEKTIGAGAYFSGGVQEDGSVAFTMNQCLYLGELPEGTSTRVNDITAAINSSGINSDSSMQIQNVEWSKFVEWIGIMPVAVLTRLPTYKIDLSPESALIYIRSLKEAAAVAKTIGVTILELSPAPLFFLLEASNDDAVNKIVELGQFVKEVMPGHKVSTLQDLERGKKMEVEETLGYLITKANEQNVQMPTLELCYGLIKAINDNL